MIHPLDSFYFQIVGEVFRLSAQVGFAALEFAVEIRVSLGCAGGEGTEHTPLTPSLGTVCTSCSFSCPAIRRKPHVGR